MIYKDQLEAVYRLIEKPENWTQGTGARNAHGDCCEWSGNEAVRWCLVGAAYKVSDSHSPGIVIDGLSLALEIFDAAHYNDNHTHAEVLALLKSAIDRAPVRHD